MSKETINVIDIRSDKVICLVAQEIQLLDKGKLTQLIGVGVSRLVGAIIEAKYDDKNGIMKWPISVSPYDCAIIPMINKNDSSNLEKSNKIYEYLKIKNINYYIYMKKFLDFIGGQIALAYLIVFFILVIAMISLAI